MSRYLWWWAQTQIATLKSVATGSTFEAVSRSDLGELLVPSMTDLAMLDIASFLDRETGKIDALIDKQHQLIATLREDRTATITHAVTKGLDPAVDMKQSGRDWFSEIPSKWGTAKLKWATSMVTSGSRGWAKFYADNGDFFIRIGNLTRNSIEFDDSAIQYVSIPSGVEGSRTVTRVGDILFSITAYLGSVAVVDKKHSGAYVSQHVSLVRLIHGLLDSRYVGYLAISETGQRQLREQAYGGTKIQLSLDDIKSIELPQPPLVEQREIANYLDAECARIDAMIDKSTDVVSTLREYRSALITAAVTGKIDVRGAV